MYYLRIQLLSDSCFSSGTRFASEVDADIAQEIKLGLPKIRGKTLKGLLVEECALILQAFSDRKWTQAAGKLFGAPGAHDSRSFILSDAHFPAEARNRIRDAVIRNINPLDSHQILQSLTDIRRQTSIDRKTGTPRKHSLRSSRLALAGLVFHAGFSLMDPEDIEDQQALLAACVLATRRGGLNRNRGWGKIKMRICQLPDHIDVTDQWVVGLLNPEEAIHE